MQSGSVHLDGGPLGHKECFDPARGQVEALHVLLTAQQQYQIADGHIVLAGAVIFQTVQPGVVAPAAADLAAALAPQGVLHVRKDRQRFQLRHVGQITAAAFRHDGGFFTGLDQAGRVKVDHPAIGAKLGVQY